MLRSAILVVLLYATTAIAQDYDDDPLARMKWFFERRAGAAGKIPPGTRARAVHHLESMMKARRAPSQSAAVEAFRAAVSAFAWTSIGPQPEHQDYGTASGRVVALAVDPTNGSIVYAGAAEGGVWKTVDGGATWTPLTDFQPSLAIGTLAIDPSNTNNIYAGTGEPDYGADSYSGAGILKSTDGGKTWTNIQGPFGGQRIAGLAVSPADGRIVLAATAVFGGFYRSNDRGLTWSRVLPNLLYGGPIVFDPHDGNTVYAGVGSPFYEGGSGVYKSTDAGLTWKLLTIPGVDHTHIGTIALAIAPSDSKVVYAGIGSGTGPVTGLYRSADGGATWSNRSTGYCLNSCGSWYTNVIGVSPNDPDLLFGGGPDLYRSTDGGLSWNQVIQQQGESFHPDQHAIAFSSDGRRLYSGNDGGVFATESFANQITHWTQLNDTLSLTQFYRGFSIHPTNINLAIGGTQDNEVLRYTGNLVWQSVSGVCGDGISALIDPTSTNIYYASCTGMLVAKSGNGGQSFGRAVNGLDQSEGAPWDAQMIMDPSDPQRLYLGGNRKVWLTTNGATTWQPGSPDLTAGKTALCALAVSPADQNNLFAGSCDGSLFITTNAMQAANSTWTRTTVAADHAISAIAIDSHDSKVLYLSAYGSGAGHVYRSVDGGAKFTNISGNLPDITCSDILIDPDVPDTLYVATDIGVFWSTDLGGTWSPLVAGLPRVAVTGLRMHRATRTLRASTHGRGMWDLQVPVAGLRLIPRLTSVSPSKVLPGSGGTTVVVAGANFLADSAARWNGSPRPTEFVSPTQLKITLTAADFQTGGKQTITVFNPAPGGGESAGLSFLVGLTPTVSAGGVVDTASLGVVANGSLASVFGSDLALTTELGTQLPLAATLGGTSVKVSGFTAPVYYASPTQLNIQIPWDLAGTLSMVVTVGGFASAPIPVTVAQFQPGIYSTNQAGSGQGVIVIAGTASLAAPVGAFPGSRPVKRGEYLTIYASGLGATTGRPANGAPAPTDRLINATCNTQVLFGKTSVPAAFAGLSPGFVGLFQVNVQVPDTIEADSAVPVSLVCSNGNRTSNVVTIAVE